MSAPAQWSDGNTANYLSASAFWIFGYGSLCWNPGFSYKKSSIGYVRGFTRKFWQGSVSHRGTKSKPGRVATLIANESAILWGIAFEIAPESSAYRYLQTRECSNGGYRVEKVMFQPEEDELQRPIEAITFIAHADNSFWLGDAPLPEIASQMVNTEGAAGHNIEYLLKLTNFVRNHLPKERDPDLFELEKLVLEHVEKRNLKLRDLLGGGASGMELEQHIQRSSREQASSSRSNDFTGRIPDKKLRCVNI